MKSILPLLVLFLFGCLEQNSSELFEPNQLERLLASDSCKTWGLVDKIVDGESILSDCEKDDYLELCLSNDATSDKIFFLFGGLIPCPGQNDSLLSEGSWFISDSTGIQQLYTIVDEDTNTFTIEFISSKFLDLSYLLSGQPAIIEYRAL